MAHRIEPDKVWNAAFISLFFISLTFNMGQNMSNQLMSVYADYLGASAGTIGVVLSSFGLTAMTFRIVSSPIMDTYNRKYVLIMASIIMSTAFLGYSMSRSIPNLIIFRLLQGCGMAFGNSCSLAMVSDMIPRDKYGAGIGYFSLAIVISQAIGPYLGLWLVDTVGFTMTFAVSAGFMLFSVFLVARLKLNFKRTKKLVISLKNIIAKEAIVPSVLIFFVTAGFSFGNSFLILHAAAQDVPSIGLYFTVNAVTMLATRSFMGKLMDKYGAVKVVLPALCFNIISCFMISFSHILWHFLAAAVVNALGMGVCQPAFQTLSMKSVSSERRGTASNTNFLGMDIASLIGPFLGGLAVEAFGYSLMFRIQTIPYIICIGVLFACRKWVSNIEAGFVRAR